MDVVPSIPFSPHGNVQRHGTLRFTFWGCPHPPEALTCPPVALRPCEPRPPPSSAGGEGRHTAVNASNSLRSCTYRPSVPVERKDTRNRITQR